ncbi:NAD-glutamate dehydrogenase [Marinospirillum insulare]|uniref:NAD-specific glutamate dehydrogenase n=1 Tax=Marinospirillum insulare TaxID=217169 RepID=A0ABQ5ZYQ8_9GAMM|nr:NAD-glutamate dehydrogenase [Marinospirillum insulare]GLR64213.1 NAD-specific glutamate dehydrogenase [Marinospirillum insulare]
MQTQQTALKEVINRLQAPKDVMHFAEHFYKFAALEELTSWSEDIFNGATLSTWKFLQSFNGDTPKIRLFNPDINLDGWQSPHTFIQLLNTDMPLLVDSLRLLINRRHLTLHSLHNAIFAVQRTSEGELEMFTAANEETSQKTESLILIEIDAITDEQERNQIQEELLTALNEVRLAVTDFTAMQNQALAISKQLKEAAEAQVQLGDELVSLSEASEFFSWIADKHFIFLGYDEYRLEEKDQQQHLCKLAGSELGLLKLDDSLTSPCTPLSSITTDLLTFAKASRLARVHRAAFPDEIIVQTFDAKGKVIGEKRFVGLYTSAVYNKIPQDIPVLRKKVTGVVKSIGMQPRSHNGRQLLQILDSYPRDDLFQIGLEELTSTALSIFNLREGRKTRVFIRQDQLSKLYSVLVYLPKDSFTTSLQLKTQKLLSEVLEAEFVDFFVHFSASALCRMQFIFHYNQATPPEYDQAAIEQQVINVASSWEDSLHTALSEDQGEAAASQLMRRYHQGFSAAYSEDFTPQHAVKDLAFLEALSDEQPLAMNLYRRADNSEQLGFKIFHLNQRLWLSDMLPVLENLGLKVMGEDPYKVTSNEKISWIHDFSLDLALEESSVVDLEAVKENFQTAFLQTWLGKSESDTFNRLILAAQLDWRQVAMLRGYARYMKQIGTHFAQDFIAATLVNQASITRLLIELFELRFNPDLTANKTASTTCLAKIEAELEGVSSLNEDQILRRYLELIQATLRTNFYQQDDAGKPKPAISYKLNPGAISNIPQPAPMFEIFVSSPRVEGVHLRYGQAARGGLRWSDRQEDFRTEVLGLVKAQQVKNAVIVPVGAKGGFICKQMPTNPSREDFMAEGIACYKTFISCLLDVTDNLVNGEVVPPQRLVRQDGDDTYLVVAADKGTATFSDIANGLAADYNFWLGDAFASGGSAGYDHKKMGITASGAWVNVQRHFRELGINVQEETFSVIGIGDMGGDVFGNGMLQSDKILLTAAFNHLHIFVDPNPADSVASFNERQRLFNLPRSSWADYQPDLISAGGGVFSRDAKSIKISPEMQTRFAITQDTLTPTELISALLKAPVDLIWNGGIGTYVKGSEESHASVGDKANDNLRVDGNQLRCRVVGEGGNLGFTQLGRIDAALTGVSINADFIDNAGGVNCSDHEVNIKILLQEVMQAGDLTLKQRNELLVEMTDEVSRLVLRDNYTQSQALAIAEQTSRKDLTPFQNLINQLEAEGKLNRELEFLPSEAQLEARAGQQLGLTRPELAIVLAYAKADVKQQILDSDLPEDPWLAKAMKRAFPEVLVERYPTLLANHRLKRELVATMLVNQLVDHLGITFVHQLQATSELSISDTIRGYAASRDIFNLEATWQAINDLDYQVEASLQLELMQQLTVGVEKSIGWLVAEMLTKEGFTNNAEQSIKNLSAKDKEALENLAGINQLEAALSKLQTSNE